MSNGITFSIIFKNNVLSCAKEFGVEIGMKRIDRSAYTGLELTAEQLNHEILHPGDIISINNNMITCKDDAIILYINGVPSLFVISNMFDLSNIAEFSARQVPIEDLPFSRQNFVYYLNNRIRISFVRRRANLYNAEVSMNWIKTFQLDFFIRSLEKKYGNRSNTVAHSKNKGKLPVTRATRAIWAHKYRLLEMVNAFL